MRHCIVHCLLDHFTGHCGCGGAAVASCESVRSVGSCSPVYMGSPHQQWNGRRHACGEGPGLQSRACVTRFWLALEVLLIQDSVSDTNDFVLKVIIILVVDQ